jgi:hypothetical protein
MSRKNSRSDSIEIFINRRRTSSSTSTSSGAGECKRNDSIDSCSISIGSMDYITLDEPDKTGILSNKTSKQILIHKDTKRRTRDVYYEVDLQPSPNPLYLSHLTHIPWKDTFSNTKK